MHRFKTTNPSSWTWDADSLEAVWTGGDHDGSEEAFTRPKCVYIYMFIYPHHPRQADEMNVASDVTC